MLALGRRWYTSGSVAVVSDASLGRGWGSKTQRLPKR